MRGNARLLVLTVLFGILLSGAVYGQDPVKWSAPMGEYPNRWVPTQPPPNPQQYPWAYQQYPYGNYYGYGYWGGYYPQGYQTDPQARVSGNPYMYPYGQ